MKLNKELIKKDFIRFNKEYFEGKLKIPLFGVRSLKNSLGLCYNNLIVISSYYDFPSRMYQTVLLHEMIHLYIRQNKLGDNKVHGRRFMSIADRINKQGGWNISNKDSVKGLPINKAKTWNVFSYKTIDGRYFMFAVCKKYIDLYKSHVFKYKDIFRDALLFESDDGILCGSLAECRKTIKGYYITETQHNSLKNKYINKLTSP